MRSRRNQSSRTNQTGKKCHIVVPYSQDLCESYKTICSKYHIQVHLKGGNTLNNLLMFPKDKDEIRKQNSIIYWFKCGKTECDDEYMWESARIFEEQYKEHLKSPSPIFEHQNTTGNTKTMDNFKIKGREVHNMVRAIKEAIYIRVNNPTLNRNVGKYSLPHIWNKVLISISELKTK